MLLQHGGGRPDMQQLHRSYEDSENHNAEWAVHGERADRSVPNLTRRSKELSTTREEMKQ